MTLINSPFMVLTFMSLMLSTIMAMSSANWIILWAAMELNLLSFIPIIMQYKNNQETEGSVKYFLAQALGSALLLMTSTSLWMPYSSMPNFNALILTSAILLKLGSVPCHFWYPSVMTSISWTPCLILSTWQKLAPLAILAFIMSQKIMTFIMFVAGMNALLGGVMGMNQSQLRTIMAYSSIGHIGWMLSLLVINKPNMSMMYFMIYSILIVPLFMMFNFFKTMTTKQLNKMPSNTPTYLVVAILLMSLGGLPPLTGFMPKFMALILLMEASKIMAFMLVLGSVLNLYFYLNIVIYMLFLTPNTKPTLNMKTSPVSTLTLVAAMTSLGLSPMIMLYAMILFNQP